MNVLNIHRGQDTGGWGHRLKEAFDRHTDWRFRSMYAPNAFLYIDYPHDLEWDRKQGAKLWKEADVIHLHNGFRVAHIFEKVGERPMVAQYHGTAYRQHPGQMLKDQVRHNAVGIVSTLDLWLIAPELTEWVPSPYNLEWLRSLSAS